MEYINRIELQGQVGSAKLTTIGGIDCLRMTIATSEIFKGTDGFATVECTWHSVVYWNKPNDTIDLSQIGKGSKVHVLGRTRTQKYTGTDGIDRTIVEVMASELTLITDEG